MGSSYCLPVRLSTIVSVSGMVDFSSSRLSAFSSWLTAPSFPFSFQFPSHLVRAGVRLARGTRYPPIVRDPESCSARCRTAAIFRPRDADGKRHTAALRPQRPSAYCIRLKNSHCDRSLFAVSVRVVLGISGAGRGEGLTPSLDQGLPPTKPQKHTKTDLQNCDVGKVLCRCRACTIIRPSQRTAVLNLG